MQRMCSACAVVFASILCCYTGTSSSLLFCAPDQILPQGAWTSADLLLCSQNDFCGLQLAAKAEWLRGELNVFRWRRSACALSDMATIAYNVVLDDGPMFDDFPATWMWPAVGTGVLDAPCPKKPGQDPVDGRGGVSRPFDAPPPAAVTLVNSHDGAK